MTETAPPRRRKPPRPPLVLDLTLGEWGPKGATLAEHDGCGMVVDRGIPGETVTAEVDRRRKPWRGVVTDVLHGNPSRIEPPCPYYGAGCGGCQWQHLAYDAQVEAKRGLVDLTMARAGVGACVAEIHAMQEPWRYRRTAAIAIGWEAGFRPRGRRGIVEIRDCPISHPSIGALAAALNDALRAGGLPNYRGKVWLDCTVVGSTERPGVQIVLQGIEGLTLERYPELPQVAETISALPDVTSVAFRHRSGDVHPLAGPFMSTIDVAGRPMWLPAGSFFQTNLVMLERLLDRMRAILRDRPIASAADVYGGTGTFALNLADVARQMVLVELDPAAVEAAARTAADWGIDNLEFVSAHAERAIPDLPSVDLLIVDPPRSGLGEPVTTAIAANGPPLVLYVSCAPGSLARDCAALLEAGYRLTSLEAFDFYPQTYHVESLAVLER